MNFRIFRFSFNFRRFIQYRGEKRGKLLKRGNSIFRRENVQSDSRIKRPGFIIWLGSYLARGRN